MELFTLNQIDLESRYQVFMEAFSDYLITFNVTLEQTRDRWIREGVRFDLSGGAREKGKPVGFIFNAIGNWEGKKTAYNAGTGILPAFRKRGLSTAIWNHVLPLLHEEGVENAMLEVIVENEPAIKVYQRLGMEITRELPCYTGHVSSYIRDKGQPKEFAIRETRQPDWPAIESLFEHLPSWGFSAECTQRTPEQYRFWEVRHQGHLIGSAALLADRGLIGHIAVHPDYRRNRIGSGLMNTMAATIEKPISAVNVDARSITATAFFERCGMKQFLRQYEMEMPLK